MRIYIAGRMNGMPDRNFPLFNATATFLRSLGHEVLNPVEIGDKHFGNDDSATTQQQFLMKDLMELLTCDAICMLPGWLGGVGAVVEAAVAKAMGFDFIDHLNGKVIDPPESICVVRSYQKGQINPGGING